MSDGAKHSFSVELASVPDREGVVAELWCDEQLLAELRHDDGQLRIQLYPNSAGEPWDLPHGQFLHALRRAQERLEGPGHPSG